MEVDTHHKYKDQVTQMMQDGNKLRLIFSLSGCEPSCRYSSVVVPHNYKKQHFFSPGEARKAFGLYLRYILRKISQPSTDWACCDLVMKFLQQSSSNLRTPFLFTVSHYDFTYCIHYVANYYFLKMKNES